MDPLSRLTPRERDLLSLMAEGRSNTAIAQALVVSTRAVGKHIASSFMKLVHTSRGRRAPPARDGGRAVSEQLAGAA